MDKPKITPAELRSCLNYEPGSGNFTWALRLARATKVGQIAGTSNGRYWQIRVCGRVYLAHRLAWLYMHGVWPEDQIDHIDGNGFNNASSNLRQCTPAQNNQNRRKRSGSSSSLIGVTRRNISRYEATIENLGRKYYLGAFPTEVQAHQAYLEAKRALHTFQPELRK